VTVIDFHPEDLLDREQRGVLTHDERARLEAHLAGCSACRVERMMRADFAADAEHMRVGSGLSSFVTAALDAARTGDACPAPRVARGRGLLGAVAAALLLGVSAAAAARTGWVEQALSAVGISLPAPVSSAPARRERAPRGPAEKPPRPALPRAPALPAAEPAHSASDAAPPVAAREATEPAREARAVVPPSAARARPRMRVAAPARSEPPAPAPRASVALAAAAPEPRADGEAMVAPEPSAAPTVEAQAPTKVARSEPSASPSGLFARAARLRREGDRSAALGAFEELTQRFPTSTEARRSHALVGRMLLDAGRARDALSAYEAYLSAGDVALREDALAGRARALALLGRDEAARAGYDALLREFPHTAYARWAERQRSGD
jgi:TolA-binding protein